MDSQTFEGDKCVSPNNVQGICANIRQCPAAIEELKARRKPQICSFQGSNPIVCCVPNNKSAAMCEKYGKELRHLRVYSIVGGTDATAREFPHMAALGFGDKNRKEWKCGGSLISDRFVLTAAHCLKDANGDVKFVRMGDIRLDGTSETQQDFDIIRRIPHPEYRPPLAYNDIALVELDRAAEYTFNVQPACLHTESTGDPGSLQAAGWGLTQYAGSASTVLQKVNLDFFNHTDCNKAYKNAKRRLPDGIVDSRQICAGGRNNEVDTCQGDSGGPLQNYRSVEDMYGIVGVTAFGKACGTINVPSVYNKVAHYVPWIESIVWP